MGSSSERSPFRTDRLVLVLIVGATLGMVVAGFGLLQATSAPSPSSSLTSSLAPTQTPVNVTVGPLSSATPISREFWGVDISAQGTANSTDGARLAATPVKVLRYPGGSLGERLNFSSNLIYSSNGKSVPANTSISDFIADCAAINCTSILQIPSEIDNTTTVDFLVNYVVETLHFQPTYWEIGDSPAGWTHLGVPWTEWNTAQATNITPLPFAYLVQNYTRAISAVDPAAHFLALGTGLFPPQFAKAWVTDLATIDGSALSGLTLHNYPDNSSAVPNTLNGFYSGLGSNVSIKQQVTHDRADILAACPNCTNLTVFVDEANAAQIPEFEPYMSTFNGSLFIAADAIQGLRLHLANLDWFCFDCNYTGAWETSAAHVQSQYYLFADVLDHLENQTVPTQVTGASHVLALTTYNSSGMALLVVNLNRSHAVKLNLSGAEFCSTPRLTESYWSSTTPLPVVSNRSVTGEPVLHPLSLALFVQGACSLHGPSEPNPGGSHAAAGARTAPVPAPPQLSLRRASRSGRVGA